MAEFIDGLYVKKPSEKAPEWVKAKFSINKEKFINWLHTQEGEYVNIDINESKKGDFYGKVDDWKPTKTESPQSGGIDSFDGIDVSDVPF